MALPKENRRVFYEMGNKYFESEIPNVELIAPAGVNLLGIDFLKKEKNNVELPEKYIINENATILFWKNGEKTVVRKTEDDEFNPRLGFLTAFFQHYCGMSKNKANKYLAGLEVENKVKVEADKPKEVIEPKKKRGRPAKLKVGCRVYHENFGKGTIVYDDGSLNLQFLVEFDNANAILHSGCPAPYEVRNKSKMNNYFWCNKSDIRLIEEDK